MLFQFNTQEFAFALNVADLPALIDTVDIHRYRRVGFGVYRTKVNDAGVYRDVVSYVDVGVQLHLGTVRTGETHGDRRIFGSGEVLCVDADVDLPLLSGFDGTAGTK